MVAEKIIMVKEVKTRNLWCVPNQNGLKCKNNLERCVGGIKVCLHFPPFCIFDNFAHDISFWGSNTQQKGLD